MSIKAILRDGVIQPVEPLPADWTEGQELLVEQPDIPLTNDEIEKWRQELADSAAQIPAEEHDRFLNALDEIERESKDAVRRQWGL